MCTITFSKSHRSTDITADSLWKSLFNRRMLCLYPKLLAILVHYQVYFFKQKFGLDWGPWHFCLILYIAFHVFLAKEEKALIYYVYKSSHSCSLAKFKFGQTWKQYKFAYSSGLAHSAFVWVSIDRSLFGGCDVLVKSPLRILLAGTTGPQHQRHLWTLASTCMHYLSRLLRCWCDWHSEEWVEFCCHTSLSKSKTLV